MPRDDITVLIVDDDAAARRLARDSLREEPYVCVEADTAETAWPLVHAHDPALVLLDLNLPGHSGMEMLEQLMAEHPETAVIMLTGAAETMSAVRAIQMGAYAYVTKPFLPQGLRIQIVSALERRRLRLENQVQHAYLAAVFENIQEGVITVDASLQVTDLNWAAARIVGLPREELVNTPFGDKFPTGFAPVTDLVDLALKSQRPVRERRIDVALDSAGGTILLCSAAPLGGPDSGRGAVLVLQDVTRVTRLEHALRERQQYGDLIGTSEPMQKIFALIENVRDTDATVLIRGESGTGKELVAQSLQAISTRAEGPFVRVNCAALSETLLESELFGHVRGAFTGAVKDRVGRFEAANHGTIFLDEIGDMSRGMQSRLLRVLQEGEFERVGDSRSIKVDVRVITATNQNLEARIASGEFRQDLYYRLNVVRIDLPPLRERPGDVPLLVTHFREVFNRSMGKTIADVSDEAMALLVRYQWPGNVRELRNCIERAFIVCHESVIQPLHLPRELLEAGSPPGHPGAQPRDERDRIEFELRQASWNVSKAARRLGVSRATLYNKIAIFGLKRPSD